jgi:hypothetical protein
MTSNPIYCGVYVSGIITCCFYDGPDSLLGVKKTVEYFSQQLLEMLLDVFGYLSLIHIFML